MLYASMMAMAMAFSGLQSSKLPGSQVAGRASVQMASVPSVSIDLPDGPNYFPVKKIDFSEYVKGKNVLLVGLPGAFTPT